MECKSTQNALPYEAPAVYTAEMVMGDNVFTGGSFFIGDMEDVEG